MPMVAIMPRWPGLNWLKPPHDELTQVICTSTRKRPRWIRCHRDDASLLPACVRFVYEYHTMAPFIIRKPGAHR